VRAPLETKTELRGARTEAIKAKARKSTCKLELKYLFSAPRGIFSIDTRAAREYVARAFTRGGKETTMRAKAGRKVATLLASLFLMSLAPVGVATAQRTLPNPVLFITGIEYYETGGKQLTRYKYSVDNRMDYPNEMFAAAPDLPPCGANTKASRTWVDIYDQSGKRLQGFCAFGKPDDLGKIWFALERDVVPPSWIYVEMSDRKTATKYKSNLAETVE
jgi:hypothetical protein